MRRREVFIGTTGVVAGFAGCSTEPSTRAATTTEAVATTGPPTEPTPDGSALRFTAEVVRQHSTDAPARVRATLENIGPPITVGFGPALLFTDNSGDLEWPIELVINPETNVGPWDEPKQTEDGCWRFPPNDRRPVQSILKERDLATDESITETYEVYTHGDSGPCMPEGTYHFRDRGFIESESHPMILTMVLRVDADGKLVARTERPKFP